MALHQPIEDSRFPEDDQPFEGAPQPLEGTRRLPGAHELPCDDGEPLETYRHHLQMNVLLDSLDYAWRDRTDYFAGGNMFLYFSEAQIRKNDFRGPDVFVVLNTTWRERLSWVVWEEDGRTPDVIIELLSPSTEKVDRGEKKHIYAKTVKVGEYFLFDPISGELEGFDLDRQRGEYVPKIPDTDTGHLPCHQLGLRLGKVRSAIHRVEVDWLRWLDKDGRVLALPVEEVRDEAKRADDEAKRADDEAKRADDEAKRADDATRRAHEATELAGRLAAELRMSKPGKAEP